MKRNLLIAVLVCGVLVSTASNAQPFFGITNTNSVFVINNVNTPTSIIGPLTLTGLASGQADTPVITAVGNTNPGLNDLLVYPNPTSSETHIVLPAVAVTSVFVDVIDLNGRIDRSFQYAPGVSQLDIDMSRLPTGLYSVRVYDQTSGYYNLKVVKE